MSGDQWGPRIPIEEVLDGWAAGMSSRRILQEPALLDYAKGCGVDLPIETVSSIIREGRRAGDPRAMRRWGKRGDGASW